MKLLTRCGLTLSIIILLLFYWPSGNTKWESAVRMWMTGNVHRRGKVIDVIFKNRRELIAKTHSQIIQILGPPNSLISSAYKYDFYSSSFMPMASYKGRLVLEFDASGKVHSVYTESD